MGGEQNPPVEPWRLPPELRRLRDGAGLTRNDVAQAMNWSVSKGIRIETGEVRVSVNDLRALLRLYEVDDNAMVDRLVEMARATRNNRWAEFRDAYKNKSFFGYIEREAAAGIIRGFDPLVLPGLLQTEEYARAILTNAGQGRKRYVSGEAAAIAAVEQRWEVRQLRQQIHDRDTPPNLSYIIDEAAIRRQVGGPTVMRQQLAQLLLWQQRPNITLKVLPFEFGSYQGMGAPFTLLEFPGGDELLLYIEGLDEGVGYQKPETTGFYINVFLDMEKRALSPEDTDRRIAHAIEDMR